jgi:hypothetical protein
MSILTLRRAAKRTSQQGRKNDTFDPMRTLAGCDASRFEDDILAAQYRYRSAKQLPACTAGVEALAS